MEIPVQRIRTIVSAATCGVILTVGLSACAPDHSLDDFGTALGAAFDTKSPAEINALISPTTPIDADGEANWELAVNNLAGASELPSNVATRVGSDGDTAVVTFTLAGASHEVNAVRTDEVWHLLVDLTSTTTSSEGFGWSFGKDVTHDVAPSVSTSLLLGVYTAAGAEPIWMEPADPAAATVTAVGVAQTVKPVDWVATDLFNVESHAAALAAFEACPLGGSVADVTTNCGVDQGFAVSRDATRTFALARATAAEADPTTGVGSPTETAWQSEPVEASTWSVNSGERFSVSSRPVRLLVTTELDPGCRQGPWAECTVQAKSRTDRPGGFTVDSVVVTPAG